MAVVEVSRRIRDRASRSWRWVNQRLSYHPDTLRLLKQFEQSPDADTSWETDFDIYLFHHGRHDFVSATAKILEPNVRARLMIRLLPDGGVGEFRSKDGKAWGIGLVREIWQQSKDKEVLAQEIVSLPMKLSQRTQLQRLF